MIVFTKAEQLEVFVDENLTLCLLLHPIAFLSVVGEAEGNASAGLMAQELLAALMFSL